MILVCDEQVSPRAIAVRDYIIDHGIPCAVSSITGVAEMFPIKVMITFCDTFNELRKAPYDDIFVIAIGSGFINTALNAVRADNMESALDLALTNIFLSLGVDPKTARMDGISLSAVYLARHFFEVYGNMIVPTKIEYLIFVYLLTTSSPGYCDANRISHFCYPSDKQTQDSNKIAVHISNLNAKFNKAIHKKPIVSKRFKGHLLEI